MSIRQTFRSGAPIPSLTSIRNIWRAANSWKLARNDYVLVECSFEYRCMLFLLQSFVNYISNMCLLSRVKCIYRWKKLNLKVRLVKTVIGFSTIKLTKKHLLTRNRKINYISLFYKHLMTTWFCWKCKSNASSMSEAPNQLIDHTVLKPTGKLSTKSRPNFFFKTSFSKVK